MTNRSELLQRMLADTCELCGSNEKVEVHHIRKLADLEKPGRREKPVWVKQMAARRRKTLIVCRKCHEEIHAGTSTAAFRKQGPESRMTRKRSSPVCAVRRVVISLPEAGGMREEIPGLLAYLEAKAEGDQACQGSGVYSKRCSVGHPYDPLAMGRARLHESNPDGVHGTTHRRNAETNVMLSVGKNRRPTFFSECERGPTRSIKGYVEALKPARTSHDDVPRDHLPVARQIVTELPYGREGHVSPGRSGEPVVGQRAAGDTG